MLFPAQPDHGEPSLSEILFYRIDALVMMSVSLSSHLATECREQGVPVIHYNRRPAEWASSVTGDNVGGARIVAQHLIAGGHQRFGYVGGTPDSSTNRDRRENFRAAIREAGFDDPVIERGFYDADQAMVATRKLLSRKDRPDALFCANDTMAIAAINVARYEFGLDVGREISIAGFDDVAMGAWPAFSLTSYQQPVVDMVDGTLRLIHQLREQPDAHEQLVCPGFLNVRGSTRPINPQRLPPHSI